MKTKNDELISTLDSDDQLYLMKAMLRFRQVQRLTGLSRSTIYRKEVAGEFPQRRKLGRNSVGWLAAEVIEWTRATERLSLAQSNQNESQTA